MSEKLYEHAHVLNTTNFPAAGSVEYSLDNFCKPDYYDLQSKGSYTANNRGGCLIKHVYATITLPDGRKIEATPFNSTGTGLSQFAIIQTAEYEFVVVTLPQ